MGDGVLVTAAPSSAVLDAAGADFPAADSDCDHELAYDRIGWPAGSLHRRATPKRRPHRYVGRDSGPH